MRSITTFVAAVVLAMAALAAHASPPQRPNILILMAEDLSARVGAFGDAVAVTPNLDALAEVGIRYPNTFTAAGVCAPSRAAHITGMYPISIGAQHMRASSAPTGKYKAVPPPEVKAYPELLRRAGYYTWTNNKLDYQFSGTMAHSGPFTIWSEEGRGGHWRNREVGQPFYGLVNFGITHESGIFQPLGNMPHSITHFVMQLMRGAEFFSVPREKVVRPEQIVVPAYYPDTPTVRADIARHYNNIAAMDAQVGAILAELKADGLLDSTIIIWTTDHGDGLPRAKRELYDSGIKVPMIVHWPEALLPAGAAVGGIDNRLISMIDFAPTLLKLAGVPRPHYLQGRSFVDDPPRDYIFATRDRIDEVPDRQRAVRDERFKYIRSWYPQQAGGHALKFRDNIDMMREMWELLEADKLAPEQRLWFEPVGRERLYDLSADPLELNNLAENTSFKLVLARLRTELSSWQARVQDWSDVDEVVMVARFQPEQVTPTTAEPQVRVQDGVVTLHANTPGASMGYQIGKQPWQVYDKPFRVSAGDRVRAKAVRYGWEESDEIVVKIGPSK